MARIRFVRIAARNDMLDWTVVALFAALSAVSAVVEAFVAVPF
jgi:hypothetical protein